MWKKKLIGGSDTEVYEYTYSQVRMSLRVEHGRIFFVKIELPYPANQKARIVANFFVSENWHLARQCQYQIKPVIEILAFLPLK